MTTEVLLYRYDLSKGLAAQMSLMLCGRYFEAVWHTSIVTFGKEYFFDGGVGIAIALPGTTAFGNPTRIDSLGFTSRSAAEFEEWNASMYRTSYGPTSYNLLTNNCNNYTNDASQFLLSTPIPEDIRTMIPNILSTPLGQMLAPTMQAMSSSGAVTSVVEAQQQRQQQQQPSSSSPAPAGVTSEQREELLLLITILQSYPDSATCLATLQTILEQILSTSAGAAPLSFSSDVVCDGGVLNYDESLALLKMVPLVADAQGGFTWTPGTSTAVAAEMLHQMRGTCGS